MKKIVLNILGLALFLNNTAQATTPENVLTLKRPDYLQKDSSEYHRHNKSYLLTAQVVGAAVAPVGGMGLNAGFYLNRNSIVQAEYSQGTYSQKMPSLYFEIEATTFELDYKHFFTNSFYMKSGAAYRKITLKNASFSYSKANGSEFGSVESLAADIAIGNQWQWESFTLGCDWIGLMLPVSTLSKQYDPYGASGKDAKELDDAWEKLANVTSAQFLRFYLGLSF